MFGAVRLITQTSPAHSRTPAERERSSARGQSFPHLVVALDGVLRRLGGTAKAWRTDRMATVVDPDTGRLRPQFAAVARHYGTRVDVCPAYRPQRKAAIEAQIAAARAAGASRAELQEAVRTAATVQENAARIHIREAERLVGADAAPQGKGTRRVG